MSYKKEIILNFPLRRKFGKKNTWDKNNIAKSEKEKLNRFYKVTESLREDEWSQEYFLIYNSYVLENA